MESKKTKESPKAKFFNGYQDFSYQDAVWNGIFVKLPNEELKQLLQLQQIEIGDDTLSKKISGSRAWGDSGSCFLQWLSDEEAYEKNWLMPFRRMVKEKNIDVFKSIQVFRSFCESIPEEKDVSDFPGFLWPAQYTARYLHEVIRCCKAADRESKTDWVAAGAYVLICLVMQNGKEVEKNPWAFVFCRPPEKYDPCPDWEYGADNETPDSQVLMIPDEIPLSQDHYDFWAELRSYFPEKQDEKKLPEDDEIWRGQIKVITPAQIHRKRIRISREVDTLLYSWHIRCGAMFLIEEVPFWNKDQWNIAVRLCKLPWTEETKKHDKSAICLEEELKKIPDDGERTFAGQIPAVAVVSKDVTEIERQLYELPTAKIQLRKEIFSDQTTFRGVWLQMDSVREACSCTSFGICNDEFDYSYPDIADVVVLHLNENGYIRNRKMEQMLKAFGMQKDVVPSDLPMRHRTHISNFEQDYLQYVFVDPLNMEVVPANVWQEKSTGIYRISITVPCSGELIAIKFATGAQDRRKIDRLLLEGYIHGLYGFERDYQKTEQILKQGWRSEEPHLAFEYGAFLKREGYQGMTGRVLKFASEHGIAGAKFLLADHLSCSYDKADIELACDLIDDLRLQGYSTYGPDHDIDLFHKYDTEKT